MSLYVAPSVSRTKQITYACASHLASLRRTATSHCDASATRQGASHPRVAPDLESVGSCSNCEPRSSERLSPFSAKHRILQHEALMAQEFVPLIWTVWSKSSPGMAVSVTAGQVFGLGNQQFREGVA